MEPQIGSFRMKQVQKDNKAGAAAKGIGFKEDVCERR